MALLDQLTLADLEKACFTEPTPGKILKGVDIQNSAPIEIFNTSPITIEGTVDVNAATTPNIYNVVVSAGQENTQKSQVLSDNTKQLLIKARTAGKIQFSFVSGETNTKFITIPSKGNYLIEGLDLTSKTLYFQIDTAPNVVEIFELS